MVSCPTQSNHWYGEGNNKVSIKSPAIKENFQFYQMNGGAAKLLELQWLMNGVTRFATCSHFRYQQCDIRVA